MPLLYAELLIIEEIVMGPGLTSFNKLVLEDPFKLSVAEEEIKEMLAQIPDVWYPHKKL